MSKNNSPFRYDYVGSFLRPESVKKQEQILKPELSLLTSFVKWKTKQSLI